MSLLTVTYMVASGRTASEIGDHLNINLLRRKEILAGFEHINDVFKNAGKVRISLSFSFFFGGVGCGWVGGRCVCVLGGGGGVLLLI